MISVYVKEQKRYYKNELAKLLKLKPDEFVTFVRKLKSYGVLKMVKAIPEEKELSELTDEEVELVNEEEDIENHFYVFTYVGILTVGNRILKCYPKYITKNEPLPEMKQVLQVLRKYNAKQQIINIFNGEAENISFNMLAVMLYLLEDYLDNGPYTNLQINIEINGTGEILWDETINETFALIKQNRPYYMELKTLNVDEDEQDYFRRLHKCIVTDCSKKLKVANITELFDLEVIDDSENKLDDFGDEDYILYRIQKELDVQFNDRKKMLLKTMYTYISHRKAFDNGLGLSMFGTNSFNLVWEAVCADVYKNCLNEKVKDLPLIEKNDCFVKDSRSLLEIIEKPKWRYRNTEYVIEQQKTLIPDLISIYHIEDNYCFSILDAKYYLIKLNKHDISGQPGVGDITKQYLYQLAYQNFIGQVGYRYVQNAFLFPGENIEGEYLGQAQFDMMMNAGDEKLEHISAIRLPAAKMYAGYIAGKENHSLFEILRNAPHREMSYGSFTSRMLAYFKIGKIKEESSHYQRGKVICYPDKIRGNIGAKIIFDIIAPEVAWHTYNYSPYVENGQNDMVAESNNDILKTNNDILIGETIAEFALNLINDYLKYVSKGKQTTDNTVHWMNDYCQANEINLIGIKNVIEEIANAMVVLYNN